LNEVTAEIAKIGRKVQELMLNNNFRQLTTKLADSTLNALAQNEEEYQKEMQYLKMCLLQLAYTSESLKEIDPDMLAGHGAEIECFYKDCEQLRKYAESKRSQLISDENCYSPFIERHSYQREVFCFLSKRILEMKDIEDIKNNQKFSRSVDMNKRSLVLGRLMDYLFPNRTNEIDRTIIDNDYRKRLCLFANIALDEMLYLAEEAKEIVQEGQDIHGEAVSKIVELVEMIEFFYEKMQSFGHGLKHMLKTHAQKQK